ncbi:MAG: bifunctional phosphoribosylaminoimidazolecarboxamide formyltransferase/IMP cyclohydrolase [Phycisphaerales bacterium]|nr:bifunctional phosphoribosylaminoimidazolecarboxamide formyltransferase/IMP cyclohydrolase [Phycisphaerales bacterium]
MPDLVPVRRALLSVSDKRGIVEFAKGLHELGIELISTGGTAKALEDAGLPVIRVEQVTGAPEMLDGRVKTLHPKIHGAILARRTPGHLKQLEAQGITPIDLVCVNLYPFEQTIAQEAVTEAEAIEQIDIGGPAMLRAAAKNYAWVTVVTLSLSTVCYSRTIELLKENGGSLPLWYRRNMAERTFRITASYDRVVMEYLSDFGDLPKGADLLELMLAKDNDLRYGENPHQQAALHVEVRNRSRGRLSSQWVKSDLLPEGHPLQPESNRIFSAPLSGKELSYNNLLDASAALSAVIDLARAGWSEVHAVVVKHTNPCGMGCASTIESAIKLALDGDPLAAYGGIMACSYPITDAAAAMIVETAKFLEVIIAPWYTDGAQQTLSTRWPNLRLLELGEVDLARRSSAPRRTIRSILGGVLIQDADEHIPDPATWQHKAGPKPTEAQLRTGVLAVIASKHLNAIAIAQADGDGVMLVGGGAGQMDRVTACRLAIEKASERAKGTVAASDAFFPFDDGPQLLIDAGVTCIIHPGGSKRDDDTFKLCDAHNVTCLTTGVRHFRH